MISVVSVNMILLKSPMVISRASKSHKVPQMEWINFGLPGLKFNTAEFTDATVTYNDYV